MYTFIESGSGALACLCVCGKLVKFYLNSNCILPTANLGRNGSGVSGVAGSRGG